MAILLGEPPRSACAPAVPPPVPVPVLLASGMLDHLTVEAYGDQQPLTALAQTALQGTTLVVRPFDPSVSGGLGPWLVWCNGTLHTWMPVQQRVRVRAREWLRGPWGWGPAFAAAL